VHYFPLFIVHPSLFLFSFFLLYTLCIHLSPNNFVSLPPMSLSITHVLVGVNSVHLSCGIYEQTNKTVTICRLISRPNASSHEQRCYRQKRSITQDWYIQIMKTCTLIHSFQRCVSLEHDTFVLLFSKDSKTNNLICTY
jgi:hypothetical protein